MQNIQWQEEQGYPEYEQFQDDRMENTGKQNGREKGVLVQNKESQLTSGTLQNKKSGQGLEVLKKYFGYDSFREGQGALIGAILSGSDALGIMPTGAGKSICYQVPALILPGITLVISPLISLMKDQVKSLNEAGVHAAYINSSLTETQISKALGLAAMGQYKIIYVAPERLMTPEFLWFAGQVQISMVTVDEAHCISQWGQDFRPSYLKIVDFINRLEQRPIVSAFTATATEEVKNDILCVLGLIAPEVMVTGFNRENLYFGVETPKNKDDFVLRYVKEHQEDSGIIYCATRKNVDMLCEKLDAQGIQVTKYHAGLGDRERRENQDDFIYDRKPVIVATNAFGMGIDKSNVRYVLHYNMPQSMENYYQEAGRAGRDGEPSECILLYSGQDVVINRYLLERKVFDDTMSREDIEAVQQRDAKRLRTIADYATTVECLRGRILKYFGENFHGDCGNCSSCQREHEDIDRTKEARQIILCVLEARERYGINVIAGTLVGSRRGKLQEYGCLEYNSYGTLKEYSEAEIKQMISWMVAQGYLWQAEDKYGLLRKGKKAQGLLDGEEAAIMRIQKRGEKEVTATRRKATSVDLNSRGYELFEKLRVLRLEIAREENMPPYIIFNDRTLVNLCVSLPFTKEEMLGVSGVGENKYAKYGERFLEEIRNFTGNVKEKMYFGEDDPKADLQEASTGRRRGKKKNFAISHELAKGFPYKERYRAPEIAEALYALVDKEIYKKLFGAEILRWVFQEDLASEKMENGYRTKFVTEKGKQKGLFMDVRVSQKGTEYLDLFFDERAQRMVVEHFVEGEG